MSDFITNLYKGMSEENIERFDKHLKLNVTIASMGLVFIIIGEITGDAFVLPGVNILRSIGTGMIMGAVIFQMVLLLKIRRNERRIS